jgi:signal transduction histidine kinase
MTADRSATNRFILHSLWVVLPFCALLALTWNAWRSDANTRRGRSLEEAHQAAERTLDEILADLGQWVPVPETDRTGTPPLPNDDPATQAARARYEAGDFEGVLGSPESARSAAGLPLRSLAALQLLRKETDPARLAELVAMLTGSMDFVTPVFLEEAERRFAELKLKPPPVLSGWRERWQRLEVETALARQLDETTPATWKEHDGHVYLIETARNSRKWRVRGETEVAGAATRALARESHGLADGLALRISAAGKSMAGPAGKSAFSSANRDTWRTEVVLADEAAYLRSDVRTRNFMAAVISVAGLAVLFGMMQAGRSYLRAVELARRQSEFMAAVSHEMRTPLAAMRLLAENLESGVADRAGRREEHTRMIREECARLGGLVDNVLAFTRGQRPEPHEAFDVASLVEDVASFMRPLAERRDISFEVTVADFPEPPHGDVAALRRALLNLLDNALKHTPAKGKVRCLVHPAEAGEWHIEISDTGPGVPVGERARIFEPFYRIGDELRRTTPGTGLGLALVHRTVEAHGGRIEVSDAPGGGSCFTLILPLHQSASKP